jgi:hypothetical protein
MLFFCLDADGCTLCNGSTCTRGGVLTCGSRCDIYSYYNNCLNALGGCNTCVDGICQGFRSGGGSCVATEEALRFRLQAGGTIELCRNSNIIINNEISTNRNNIILRCFGGGTGCTIRRSSSGLARLIHFTGRSITLQGVTFQNGSAIGSVRDQMCLCVGCVSFSFSLLT